MILHFDEFISFLLGFSSLGLSLSFTYLILSRMQVVCHGDVTEKSKQVICHKVSHKVVIIIWIVWFICVLLCSHVGYENMNLNEQNLRDLNIKT